jgi:C4-dicarboxylate-specific signal transduction histidine kinase
VQFHQLLMNLVMNGIDAVKDVDGMQELSLESQPAKNEQLLVSVSDTGVGFRISRSIVESQRRPIVGC